MAALFPNLPKAVSNTRAIADKVTEPAFNLNKKGYPEKDNTLVFTLVGGEYVDYDEVTVTIDETTTDGSTTTHTHIEASETRIEDVEWEDI